MLQEARHGALVYTTERCILDVQSETLRLSTRVRNDRDSQSMGILCVLKFDLASLHRGTTNQLIVSRKVGCLESNIDEVREQLGL